MDAYGRGKVKYLRWVDGRQGDGYKIMYLWNKWFDLVLIRYPTGSFIKRHVDPVPKEFKHYRLNITLRRPGEGGRFDCEYAPLIFGMEEGTFKQGWRWTLFRPDIQPHRVSRITKGERWVLSIGWLRRRK